MDEYKEAGLEFRHHDTQISAANRLMLPPLVIGLLVLYGEVDKFLGVEFKNPEAARLLIWSGCMIISLIWVFNVSRTAQLVHSHLDTRRKNAEIFGLRGHTKIFIMDRDSGFSKIFRHNKLRLFGFGLYFFLLLLKLKSLHFHGVLSFLNSIEWRFILGIAIIVSAYVSGWIWYIYFKAPLRSSRATPTKLLAIIKQKFHDIKKWIFQATLTKLLAIIKQKFHDIKKWTFQATLTKLLAIIKQKFHDIKKWIFQASIMKWIFQYIMKPTFQYIIPIIIFPGLFALPILMYADLQEQPDANACLVRGLKNFAKGEYTEAIEDFNIAIAVDSNNAGAYFNRGSAYYKTGEFANAIVDLDKAIMLDPQNQGARALRDEAHKELVNQPNNKE